MIDVNKHTKDEIISHLISNELAEIQKRFYSHIDENREEMIKTPIYVIFGKDGESRINQGDDINYISSSMFEKFNVGFLFKNIERHFEVDRMYIIADENKYKATWLSNNFNATHNIFFFKELQILLDKNVFIMLKFKIKNRWVRFYITRDDITYKFFKKHR